MTLKELRARLPVGAIFTCVENTLRPTLNGQRRIVVKVQIASIAWKELDANDQPVGERSWTQFPKASQILKSDTETVTFNLGHGDDHTLTLRLP